MDDKSKRIFKYFDGTRERFADPLVVEDLWRGAVEDPELLDEQCKSPIWEVAHEAGSKLIEAIHKMFDLKPIDTFTGEGITSEETLEIWGDFWRWRDDVKKNTETTPDGSPPSDADLSTPPNPDASTSSTTASG